jgi:hypothetical protein
MDDTLRIVTENDVAFIQNDEEVEYDKAVEIVSKLYGDFVYQHDTKPTKIYVSDNEELQSYIMWVVTTFGLKYERTEKKTYME